MNLRTPFLLANAFLCLAMVTQAQAPAKTNPSSLAVPAPADDQSASRDYQLLVIQATPYQPKLARDPFSAPSDVENARKGDLIDDIGVKGRIVSNGKVMAVVIDSRGNARWLSAGYKFRDGELFQITEKAVIFHQRDVNSTSGVYRTVVKSFMREGGK